MEGVRGGQGSLWQLEEATAARPREPCLPATRGRREHTLRGCWSPVLGEDPPPPRVLSAELQVWAYLCCPAWLALNSRKAALWWALGPPATGLYSGFSMLGSGCGIGDPGGLGRGVLGTEVRSQPALLPPQRSVRPSKSLTAMAMASSPSRSWARPCAPWATCPTRWSWKLSSSGWTWMVSANPCLCFLTPHLGL